MTDVVHHLRNKLRGRFAVAIASLLLVSAIAANCAEPMIITTTSKQFVVRGKPQTTMLAKNDKNLVYLDPPLLAMVCERVRTALRKELGWTDRWRDSIFIDLYTASGQGDRPNIQVISAGPRGWRYRIEMPDELNRREVVAPIIEALLLEYANRGARDQSVELPPWLLDGITEHLMHESLAGLVMQRQSLVGPEPGVQVQRDAIVVVDSRSDDSAAWLRKKVQEKGVLSVDQLNWPDFDDSDDKANEAYRLSAHLFVRELLHMNGGRDALSASLALLPEHLNWQGAFLLAFDTHFKRMLDVEKWWSMVVVQTKTREQSIIWSMSESQARLEEILYTPMQVRLTKEELPHVTPVSLQTLMSEWSFQEQAPILRQKNIQLLSLRQRIPPEFVPVLDEYRGIIEKYIITRSSKKFAGRDASSRAVKSLLKTVTAELTAADQRRVETIKQVIAKATAPHDQAKADVPVGAGTTDGAARTPPRFQPLKAGK